MQERLVLVNHLSTGSTARRLLFHMVTTKPSKFVFKNELLTNLVEIETNVSKLFQYETTQTHVLYSTSFGLGLWKPTPLVKNVRTYTSADQPQVSVGILTPLPSSGIQNVAVPCSIKISK